MSQRDGYKIIQNLSLELGKEKCHKFYPKIPFCIAMI